jgi:hypothetical protein
VKVHRITGELACCLATLLSTAFFSASPAAAQSTAAIVGTVRDPSGAAVPNATVTVTNVGTSLSQTRSSSGEGAFSFPLLPVGEYRLEVESPGFQRYIRTGIQLAVNDKPTIDVTMQLGQTAESVTVTGSAPLIEAQTGTLRGLVDQQRIVNLPLNGRDMVQLISVQAGAIKTSDAAAGGEGIAYAVNGSRQNGVYYLMDGGYNTSTYRNWSGTFPNPDAVQEFAVQRSNFTAEYANATGAVVNVVTKSGTNEFHGSAFWFMRNAVLNARNFFAATRDSLKRNQYGATLGGPVLRDKLFFFAAFQGTTLRSDPRLSPQFLPTAAMRAGDFSAIARPIRDPQTGQPFPSNQIPVTRFSTVSTAFLKYIPLPPAADGRRLIGSPTVRDENEYTFRGDYNLAKHRFSGKYFQTISRVPFLANENDVTIPLVRNNTQPYRQASLNYLFSASPSVINNAIFAYRYRGRSDDWGDFEYPINWQNAGMKGIAMTKPAGFYINVSGAFAATPSWPYQIEDSDWHFSNTLNNIRGRHELKIGGEIIRSRNQIRNQYRQFGFFDFNGSITGDAMADFLLGEAYQLWQGGGEYKDLSGTRFGLFLQDDFRATSNLTLNFGVRWDPTLPFTDALGRLQCFRPGMQSTRFPNSPPGYLSAGDQGCPTGGFEPYYRSISPRFGFAWRPWGGKSVVRGGFGLFWNPQFTAIYNGFVNSAPFSPQVTINGIKFDDPYAGVANPFPASFAPFEPPANSAIFTPLGTYGTFGEGFVPSYQESFNFTIEREVAPNMVARASYVGNLGRRLAYPEDINYARYVPGNSSVQNIQARRPYNRDYTRILVAVPGATSSYHALQTSVERRMARSLSFEANYTWSKAIDQYSTDVSPGFGAMPIPGNRRANQGLADFDVPHRMVLSYVWALPRLEGQSPWLRQTVGGWESSGILTLQSGRPFSILSGVDNSFSGIASDFADIVGDPYLDTSRSRGQLINQYFNTAAFAPNRVGTFGTAPRSVLRGPGLATFDMALIKSFPIKERMAVQFRSEFFNLFNRPNFGNPYNVQRVAARFGKIESAGDPRILQFALKVSF